jgi:transposase
MINRRDYMEIKAQRGRGVYITDIAADLKLSPKTVSRALKRQGPPAGKRPGARVSKLDPYKEFVDRELDAGVWNAEVILIKLKKLGYEGGITLVKDYMRPKRPLRKKKACVRFETQPGQQMQSDWGEIEARVAGEETVVHFCCNTLGYSRRTHFFINDSCDAEHTCEAQQRAFSWFGGAPGEVLIDNQKVAVSEHEVKEGRTERLIFNSRFLDFLAHYGCTPRACKPNRPETKGKVENHVGYIKGNFFLLYPEADSLGHYNQLAESWLREIADARVHGTTGRVVEEMFEEEKKSLLALPPIPFDTSYREERVVSWDSMVEVRGNRYSVPDHLCGKRVRVRIGLDGTLKVFHGGMLVACHLLRSRSQGWVVVPGHHKNLWADVLSVEKRPLSVYEEVGS